MDDFGYDRLVRKQKTGLSVQTQVLIFVGLLAVLFFGYLIYQNYVLIKTGEFERVEKDSKRNKRNRETWNVSEVG